jgi:hypothetical protein
VDIRPENEYDKLLRLSNEYFDDKASDIRPCGGFSLRYECACDFYQVQCYRPVQNVSFSKERNRIFVITSLIIS